MLGLLAVAVTITGTVTVGDLGEPAVPLAGAVVHAVLPDAPPLARTRETPLHLRCTDEGLQPSVAVATSRRPLVIENGRSTLVPVTIATADGLELLAASLVARTQRTPPVHLPAGRVVVTCRGADATLRADLLVLGHEALAVTDARGRYRLEAPAGAPLVAWHPELGRVEASTSSTSWSPRF